MADHDVTAERAPSPKRRKEAEERPAAGETPTQTPPPSPLLHPLAASLAPTRVARGLPFALQALQSLCYKETREGELQEAFKNPCGAVRRAAQALVGLERLVDMMTGMVLIKLYTQPCLPRQTNQPLGERVELRRREGVQWEDVERVVDVFCRSEMEKMWKVYCGKVEKEGKPMNASNTIYQAFLERERRWQPLRFIIHHTRSVRLSDPCNTAENVFQASREKLRESMLPVEAILREAALHYAANRLAFPFKRQYFSIEPAPALAPGKRGAARDMFNALRHFDARERLSREPAQPHNVRFEAYWQGRRMLPLVFEGQESLCLVHRDDDYLQMDVIVDIFQEPARMAAQRKDAESDPLTLWSRPDAALPLATLQASLEQYNAVGAYELREALYTQRIVKECTQFKPSLALAIMQYFGARRVLDFSAGWGDRLAAALAAPNVERYAAWDPNQALRAGHAALVHLFAPPGQQASYTVTYAPFETADLSSAGERFNLVFTSPPFFDFEIYTDAPGQSVLAYSTLDAWLVHFLLRCLRQAWAVLDDGGHVVIHITDVYKTKVCEKMCLLALWKLPGLWYRGVITSRGAAGRPRPLWVFAKRAPGAAGERGWVGGADAVRQAEAELKRIYESTWRTAVESEVAAGAEAEEDGR